MAWEMLAYVQHPLQACRSGSAEGHIHLKSRRTVESFWTYWIKSTTIEHTGLINWITVTGIIEHTLLNQDFRKKHLSWLLLTTSWDLVGLGVAFSHNRNGMNTLQTITVVLRSKPTVNPTWCNWRRVAFYSLKCGSSTPAEVLGLL